MFLFDIVDISAGEAAGIISVIVGAILTLIGWIFSRRERVSGQEFEALLENRKVLEDRVQKLEERLQHAEEVIEERDHHIKDLEDTNKVLCSQVKDLETTQTEQAKQLKIFADKLLEARTIGWVLANQRDQMARLKNIPTSIDQLNHG